MPEAGEESDDFSSRVAQMPPFLVIQPYIAAA